MRAVVQRVRRAAVTADGIPAGMCDGGLLILLGVARGDTAEDALALAEKISKMRIFCDENSKMNLSVRDIGGGALVVSNFTLCAAYAKGNRPDFFAAEDPAAAKKLYDQFSRLLAERIGHVGCGVFGADMQISTELDGPVTIVMDSEVLRKGGRA